MWNKLTTALVAVLAFSTVDPLYANALRTDGTAKERTKLPSWRDIGKVAVDTLFEDVNPSKLAQKMQDSHEASMLAARG